MNTVYYNFNYKIESLENKLCDIVWGQFRIEK
jgi:hypothetical protein